MMRFVTERAVDLRRVTGEGGEKMLVPVGLPRAVAAGAGTPILEVEDAGGEKIAVCASGMRLSLAGSDGIIAGWTMPGRIRCAAAVPSGCITVMTEGSGPAVLRQNAAGGWEQEQEAPRDAPVITSESVAAFSEPVDLVTLSPGYAAGGVTLLPAHRVKLTQAIGEAYRRLNARSAAAGGWFQPVIARTRTVDASGRTLYVSQLVMVGTASALKLTGSLAFGDKSSAVEGLTLSARPFRLRVSCPKPLPEGVRIVVEVSPQLHPFDPAGVSECRLTRLDATHARLDASLPGVRLDADGSAAVARHVPRVITSLDSLCDSVGELRCGTLYTLFSAPRGESVEADIKRIGAAGSSPSAAVIAATAVPHRFSAAAARVSGTTVVWAGIEPLPLAAPSVSELAAAGTAGGCTGSVQVTFSGSDSAGTPYSTVRTFALPDYTPTALSPLIVYPDARATALRVAVGTAWVKVPLVPAPDGRSAYYLAPDLLPVEISQSGSATVPAANPPAMRLPGGIIVADAADPFVPRASAELPGGSIVAVAEGARSRSSWDFARRHFYLFATSGIYALTVDSRGTGLSLARISPAEVTAPAVAATPQGVAAIAGGRLVMVSGSVARIVEDVDARGATALGYDPARGELWIGGPDAAATRVLADDGFIYERTPGVDALCGSGGRLWIAARGGMLRVTGTDEPEPAADSLVKIFWEGRAIARGERVRGVEWHLTARAVAAVMRVSGDGGFGSEGATPLTALRVDGQLNSPLTARLIAPPRRNLSATIQGLVSPDARFFGANIQF